MRWRPSYLSRLTLGAIELRASQLRELLRECTVCPRECGARRLEGRYGVCRSTNQVVISSVGPHFGEEPPLVGSHGSGTIFFSSCNLKCLYCQNFEISQSRFGHPVSIRQLARHMLWLQELGCHNVNLVTPTHFSPQIVEALALAVQGGLTIPIVYNCGGFESVQTLRLLEDIVDIYMPDIKYSDDENARTYSGVKHYWAVAQEAVKEMHRQVGDLDCDEHGMARRGLLLRHLVLPNGIAGSAKVVDFVRDEISPHSYINIMDQYRPAYRAGRHGVLNRRPTSSEYNRVVNHAAARGLHRGFKEGEHVLFSQN